MDKKSLKKRRQYRFVNSIKRKEVIPLKLVKDTAQG